MRKLRATLWIAPLAIAFVANLLYSNIYLPFRGMPPVGIEVGVSNNEVTIWSVDPGSPGGTAGALLGDKVRAFNGQPVRELNDYLIPDQLISPNQPAVISVERNGRPVALQLRITGTYFDSLTKINRAALLFWIVISGLELAFALFLALARPHDPSALSASLFLAVLTGLNLHATGSAAAFRILPVFLRGIIYPVQLLSLEILFFAFFFCASFPRPLFRWTTCIKFSIPAALIYIYLILLNLPLCFGPQPERMFQLGAGVYFAVVKIPLLLVLCGYGVAALIALVVKFRRCDKVERRRIKLMSLGALIGLGGVVPTAIIHDLVYSDLISRSGLISIAFGLLRIVFLVCFVYAVLKHRVFEIPVLLQRSGRYLLVQRGYLIILGLAGVASTWIFARVLAQRFPAEATYSVPIGAVFGVGLIWLGSLVHKRIQHRLDRAFFRSAYDAQQVLEEMAELSRRATSRSELIELLRKNVDRALHPTVLMILIEDLKGHLESAQDNGRPSLTVDASSPRLKALGRSGKAVELGEQDWEKTEFKDFAPLRPECLVPIIGRTDRLLGLLVLGSKLSEEPYSSTDLRLLQSAARQAGVALENISLAEDIAQRLQAERLAAHELAIAREVQSKLLPGAAPLLASIECVGRCIQAKQVGGDFYDFIEYGERKIGLVLADIAGKGISAALLMASLQAHLRSHRMGSPGEIAAALESVNRHFRKSIEVGGFATLFFGFYDDATGVLTYANCGHAPAVLMRQDGRVRRLESTATVVGAFADWECEVQEINLGEGDVLVLYSDGITEAENAEGELFGEARLLELLQGCKDLPADRLVDVIIGGALDFSRNQQADDITLVVTKSLAVPTSKTTPAQLKANA
ncbi:MAG: SpoIIE family protein phosphatase [Terriglobales bacterium]